MPNTCVACAIASGQAPAHIIHQNERIICFLDHAPINPGHILICPREHLADLTDLPEDLLTEIAKAARDMAQLLKDKLGCDGVSLLQNNGTFNDLGHFHLHIFPRYAGDGFGWTNTQLKAVQPTSKEALALLALIGLGRKELVDGKSADGIKFLDEMDD